MSRVATWISRNPWIVLGVALVTTVWLGFYAWEIRIESAIESVLPRGDRTVAYYDQVRETFGSDDIGVIGVGEGTTAAFPRHLFDYLKLNPRDFYAQAEPTWK